MHNLKTIQLKSMKIPTKNQTFFVGLKGLIIISDYNPILFRSLFLRDAFRSIDAERSRFEATLKSDSVRRYCQQIDFFTHFRDGVYEENRFTGKIII